MFCPPPPPPGSSLISIPSPHPELTSFLLSYHPAAWRHSGHASALPGADPQCGQGCAGLPTDAASSPGGACVPYGALRYLVLGLRIGLSSRFSSTAPLGPDSIWEQLDHGLKLALFREHEDGHLLGPQGWPRTHPTALSSLPTLASGEAVGVKLTLQEMLKKSVYWRKEPCFYTNPLKISWHNSFKMQG